MLVPAKSTTRVRLATFNMGEELLGILGVGNYTAPCIPEISTPPANCPFVIKQLTTTNSLVCEVTWRMLALLPAAQGRIFIEFLPYKVAHESPASGLHPI